MSDAWKNFERRVAKKLGGERIPVAVKTQRSKQGESGKLSTTYQWHKDTQKCFKGKS